MFNISRIVISWAKMFGAAATSNEGRTPSYGETINDRWHCRMSTAPGPPVNFGSLTKMNG